MKSRQFRVSPEIFVECFHLPAGAYLQHVEMDGCFVKVVVSHQDFPESPEPVDCLPNYRKVHGVVEFNDWGVKS